MSTTLEEQEVEGDGGWDCTTLLEAATAQEAGFAMQHPSPVNVFGHPDSPRLGVSCVFSRRHLPGADGASRDEEVVLAVAYTDHCVVAQTMASGRRLPAEVLVIGSLPVLDSEPEEDAEPTGSNESITCLTMVTLESLDFLGESNRAPPTESMDKSAAVVPMDSEEPTQSDPNDGPAPMDTSPDHADNDQVPDPHAAPLPKEYRLAILLGTSHTRVYSAEVVVTVSTTLEGVLESRLAFSPTMVGRNANFVEVLPTDDEDTMEMLARYARRQKGAVVVEAFLPTGKVLSMVPFRLKVLSGPIVKKAYTTYVWVTYQDGTLLRFHHAALFPSVWEIGAARQVSLEELLRPVAGFDQAVGGAPVVRCRLMLPPAKKEATCQILPLPRYHPSPLAPLANRDADNASAVSSMNDTVSNTENLHVPEFFEALVFGDKEDPLTPTLMFYTSEDQFLGRIKGDIDVQMQGSVSSDNFVSSVVGSTKAVVEGVAGVFRWGLGVSRGSNITSSTAGPNAGLSRRNSLSSMPSRRNSLSSMPETHISGLDVEEELPMTPFPSLWFPSTPLYPGYEFHDAPREMESCVVDPNGRLAALTDSLGRVLLVDLSTKQIVRMWKGFRDTTCHWINSGDKKNNLSGVFPTTHLAIHSRHRRVVEVWQVRHGPRVQLTQVDRDARLVSSMVGSSDSPSNRAETFLIHSLVPGGHNQMSRLQLSQAERISANGDAASASLGSSKGLPSSRGAALRLQHLRQLLSATNFECTKTDVLEAVQKIKSLGDLATALDLIGTASVLEERLGVEGSSFQKSIQEYCNETLSGATSNGNDDILHSPSAKTLSRKLDCYSRLVKAYDLLDTFEMPGSEKAEHTGTRAPFVEEALGWTATYEKVTGSAIPDTIADSAHERLRFSAFAASVAFPSDDNYRDTMQIYFADSSRTRRDILVHVFRPLLGWFSSSIVESLLDILGIRSDTAYVQKCFGEWFATLSSGHMVKNGLALPESPMNRFLEEMATQQVGTEGVVPLESLQAFCRQSTDLIRAFVLATICRRAVVRAVGRIENSNYGKISLSGRIQGWETLLRKIRVCLLASLRLQGQKLGALPLSVHAFETENEFSVYEWLARDELAISHAHDEITIFEEACRMSIYSFDPSTDQTDDALHVATVQKACLHSHASLESEENSDSSTLLLFYPHHNIGTILAAHRSLLLASSWLKSPDKLTVLADSLEAAHALKEEASLALAVRLELWTRVVCPVYRARLFGFVDVPELVEDDFVPLMQDHQWLNDFGRLALRVLDMVTEVEWHEDIHTFDWPASDATNEWWPPLQSDFILERALLKVRPLDESARDAHYVVICGLLVSEDMNALAPCVPAIYDCFLSLSLFNPVTVLPSPSPDQDTFLASAILLQARNYTGQPLENFRLGELAILGSKWGFSLATLRTLYLLAMYEFGKDTLVDDLLTRAFTLIDAFRFLDGGLDIVCRRLDEFFQSDFMKRRHMREVMGVLDADLCDWIQQQAASAEQGSIGPVVADPLTGLNLTHVLALRLLSLSKMASVDTTLRVKIHSLAVLSGTLLKEVEEAQRQQRN